MIALTKEEQKTLLELLAEIPEFRKGNAIKYSLRDVLFLVIIAVLRSLLTPHSFLSLLILSEVYSSTCRHRVFSCFLWAQSFSVQLAQRR